MRNNFELNIKDYENVRRGYTKSKKYEIAM